VKLDALREGGILKNTASVRYDEVDQYEPEDESPAEVMDDPIKFVMGRATGAPIQVGETFTYEITYHAPAAATAITITDTLPAGVTYVSSTPMATMTAPRTYEWTLDPAAGRQGSVTITVRLASMPADGELKNTASVKYDTGESFDPIDTRPATPPPPGPGGDGGRRARGGADEGVLGAEDDYLGMVSRNLGDTCE